VAFLLGRLSRFGEMEAGRQSPETKRYLLKVVYRITRVAMRLASLESRGTVETISTSTPSTA
jgi:hypothetical protein